MRDEDVFVREMRVWRALEAQEEFREVGSRGYFRIRRHVLDCWFRDGYYGRPS